MVAQQAYSPRVNVGTIGHSDKRIIIVGNFFYTSTLRPAQSAIVYSSTEAPLPPERYKDCYITSSCTTDDAFVPRTRRTGKCKLCGKFQSDVEDHEGRCPARFRVIHRKRK